MDTSKIQGSGTRAFAAVKAAIPSQGQLLTETLDAMAAAVPESGVRKLTATEIGECLKLSPDDMKRFVPLVVEASITKSPEGGAIRLLLRDEFTYRGHPDARELLIRTTFLGTIKPGRLDVKEGLQAIVNILINTNIKSMEKQTQNGKPGVFVVAGMGSEFYPA